MKLLHGHERPPIAQKYVLRATGITESCDACHSWDSHVNKYHGESGFPFTCAFDRVFLACAEQPGDGVRFSSGPDCAVSNVRLVGNTPASANASHFLSDHFGLVFDLMWHADPQP